MNSHSAKTLTDKLLEMVPNEILQDVLREQAAKKDYGIYQADPYGFCTKELNLIITDDVRRMMESVAVNRVTIAVSGNGPGKTFGAAATGIWFKKAFQGSQVITAAPPPAERNLKKKLWAEIRKLVRAHPEMFPPDLWRLGSLDLIEKADDLSFMTGVTIPSTGGDEEKEARLSGSHNRNLLFIFDEGDALGDFAYNGADGCMSGGNARMLIMFNPRRKAGAAYRKIKNGQASVVNLSVFRHPNVVTGKQIVPGACDRDTTIKRINEWSEPLRPGERPDQVGAFEVPDFLVGCTAKNDAGIPYPPLTGGHRTVTDSRLSYMVLGEYPPEGANQLISEVRWDNAVLRWQIWKQNYGDKPPQGITPVLGLDAADEGEDGNALIERYGSWVSELDTWSKVNPVLSGERGAKRYHELKARALCIDGNGVGAGSVGEARKAYRWKCVNPDCPWEQRTVATGYLESCPDCGWGVRKVGTFVVKVMTAETPTEKWKDLGQNLGEFNKLRDQLAWIAREWLLTDDNAMLPPNQRLKDAALCITYENYKGRMRVTPKEEMRRLLGRSPDEWDAFVLTFAHGMGQKRHGVRYL